MSLPSSMAPMTTTGRKEGTGDMFPREPHDHDESVLAVTFSSTSSHLICSASSAACVAWRRPVWQSHLQPPSPVMDPAQQKMMRYMPLLILVFLYNFSAGLALYWTVNNLLTVLQTKLTKMKQPDAPATNPALTPLQKKKK